MNRKEKEDNLTIKKELMLSALEETKSVVTLAIKKIGISRDTHYRWLKEDPEYQESVEKIDNVALDFVESKLLDRIEAGDTTAIIFFLKTKGRNRGYNERSLIADRSQTIKIEVHERLISQQIDNVKCLSPSTLKL